MIGAAKRKSLSPPGPSALWSILLLVVALCLPETRVWGFAATPQPASGVFESASPSSVGEFTTATAYDVSGSPVAARTTPKITDLIRTDKMGTREFNKLVESIKTQGLKDPVIRYVDVDGVPYVVQGSNRLKAARSLQIEDQLQLEKVQIPFRGYKTEQDVIDAAIDLGTYRGN